MELTDGMRTTARAASAAGELKHRWSVANNHLAGISAREWWRLLRENRFAVDPAYWHRAAFITLLSLIREPLAVLESRYDRAVADVELTRPPVFILGYWRSGTTHLHNLLAQDVAQFAAPTTYQVFNPRIFLATEPLFTRLFSIFMPGGRPADGVSRAFQSPEEDEMVTCLTTLRSPYIGMSFPRREAHYRRYLTFRDVSSEERAEWEAALVWFLKKLTFRTRRAALLKSPPHTARIGLLLDLFPNARFVHIHRNPYDVFRSALGLVDTAYWYTYLQRPDLEGVEDRILAEYNEVYDAFFAEKERIPAGQFCEVAYESVAADPVGEVRRIYTALGLPGLEAALPRLEAYVSSVAGYRKNRHPDLAPKLRRRIATAWKRSFDAWDYPTGIEEAGSPVPTRERAASY